MTNQTLNLIYKINVDQKFLDKKQKEILQLFKIDSTEITLKVSVNNTNIKIDFLDKIINLNLKTSELIWYDNKTNEYHTTEFKLNDRSLKKYSINYSSKIREVIIEKENKRLKNFTLNFKNIIAEVWTINENLGILDYGLNQFWNLLLPNSKKQFLRAGIPYEIIVKNPAKPSEIFLRYFLEKLYYGNQDVEFSVPQNSKKKDLTKLYDMVFPKKNQIDNHHSDTTKKVKENLFTKERHNLRGSGQDFAWITNQEFLDTIKNLANSVFKGFDRFSTSGDTGPLRVELDFWSQLSEHINNGDFVDERINVVDSTPFTSTLTLDSLLDAFICFKVVKAKPEDRFEDKFTDDLTKSKIRDIIGTQPMIDEENGRREGDDELMIRKLSKFRSSNPEIGFERLSDRVNLAKGLIFSTTTFNLTDPPMTEWVSPTTAENPVEVNIYNLDTDLVIGNQPILNTLKYENGLIRLELLIPEFSIDFFYWTYPETDNWWALISWISAPLLINNGIATAELENIQLSFVLIPERAEGQIKLALDFDIDNSHIPDFSYFFIGINPVSDVLAWISYGVFIAVGGPASIFMKLANKIKQSLNISLLEWTSFWKAKDSISVTPFTVLFSEDSQSGIWEGHANLRHSVSLRSNVDTSFADQTAFMLNRAYINDWFIKLVGNPPAEINFDVNELLDRFGLDDMPDPSIYDNPETGGPPRDIDLPAYFDVPPRPAEGVQSFDVFRMRRSLPVVYMPSEGNSRVAAYFNFNYDIFFGARRTWDVPRLVSAGGGYGMEPPSLYWEYQQFSADIHPYFTALVRVHGSLLIDFVNENESSASFLPIIKLTVQRELSSATMLDTMENPLRIDQRILQNYLSDIAEDNTRTLLTAANLFNTHPCVSRSLINFNIPPKVPNPLFPIPPNEDMITYIDTYFLLENVLVFHGIGILEKIFKVHQTNNGLSDPVNPQYQIKNGQLYWPIKVLESISSRFR